MDVILDEFAKYKEDNTDEKFLLESGFTQNMLSCNPDFLSVIINNFINSMTNTYTHCSSNTVNDIYMFLLNKYFLSSKIILFDNIIFTNPPPRINQKDALESMFNNRTMINNRYDVPKTGICCQATGCGKSYISLNLIKMIGMLNNYNVNITILWFTERKSILTDLFLQHTDNGYIPDVDKWITWENNNLINMNNWQFCDFVNNNETKWYNTVNTTMDKPKIIIINRTWLTNNNSYRYIEHNIPCVIIHDEMHSCTNESSYQFFRYVKRFWKSSIIGFSATPVRTFNDYTMTRLKHIYSDGIDNNINFISNFNIAHAINYDIILPPKIILFNATIIDEKYMIYNNNATTISNNEFINLMKCLNTHISNLPYKKLIGWCGTIKRCDEWKKLFDSHKKNYPNLINIKSYIDHSNHNDYNIFKQTDIVNSILFCADKHREGSDIDLLDGCMFLDNVRTRSPLVLIQCIGRVLRKDRNNLKKCGLVIDSYISDNKDNANQDVINKIIDYYEKINNCSTYHKKYKDKFLQFNEIIKRLVIDVKTHKITINVNNIAVDISCGDITWHKPERVLRGEIHYIIKEKLGFPDSTLVLEQKIKEQQEQLDKLYNDTEKINTAHNIQLEIIKEQAKQQAYLLKIEHVKIEEHNIRLESELNIYKTEKQKQDAQLNEYKLTIYERKIKESQIINERQNQLNEYKMKIQEQEKQLNEYKMKTQEQEKQLNEYKIKIQEQENKIILKEREIKEHQIQLVKQAEIISAHNNKIDELYQKYNASKTIIVHNTQKEEHICKKKEEYISQYKSKINILNQKISILKCNEQEILKNNSAKTIIIRNMQKERDDKVKETNATLKRKDDTIHKLKIRLKRKQKKPSWFLF
jgi:hypothetical protein